jgi:hypothetical protein
MRHLFLIVAALVMMAASAIGQLIVPSALAYETQSGRVVTARISYWTPGAPYDDIVGEWFALLAPGLSPASPTGPPFGQPWGGSPPPLELGIQWLGTPLSPPSGPVLLPFSQQQTGEAVPAPSVYGGCAWGYAAMGVGFSGPMDMAVWAIPAGLNISGWWVYFAGTTLSETYGRRYWGAWGMVR